MISNNELYDVLYDEAFKLKTDAFYGKEQKEIDAGNVDIEMEKAYC